MHDSDKQDRIKHLLIRFFDNDLDDQQRDELLEWSQNDPNASHDYWNFVKDLSIIQAQVASQIQTEPDVLEDTSFDHAIMAALAQEERSAPAVEIPVENPKRPLIQKVVYPPRQKRHLSKFSMYSFAASAAAILFLVLLHFMPLQPAIHEAATMVDAIHATWADSEYAIAVGARISTDRGPYQLAEGTVKILTDPGTEVLIEGPAKFAFSTPAKLELSYGKLYARVSQAAAGFTVITSNAQIVDMGTEFGVFADLNRSSEIHVIKGKVRLETGPEEFPTSEMLTETTAAVIDHNQTIRTIPYQNHLFVRDINSSQNVTWKGDTRFCLADLLAGGDGFSKTISKRGIDPGTGQIKNRATRFDTRPGKKQNGTVNGIEGIDSVFIPDKTNSGTQIASTGLKFNGFPNTDFNFWSDITTDVWIPKGLAANSATWPAQQKATLPVLNGRRYGDNEQSPAILLCPNVGITFDLNQIRKKLKHQQIELFRAVCGTPDNVKPDEPIKFWVLVDGVQKFYVRVGSTDERTRAIQIPIAPDDRFLSLATTISHPNPSFCWALFAEPQLVLKHTSN